MFMGRSGVELGRGCCKVERKFMEEEQVHIIFVLRIDF